MFVTMGWAKLAMLMRAGLMEPTLDAAADFANSYMARTERRRPPIVLTTHQQMLASNDRGIQYGMVDRWFWRCAERASLGKLWLGKPTRAGMPSADFLQ